MKTKCIECNCEIKQGLIYCDLCQSKIDEYELQQQEEYYKRLQWEENMNNLYHYDEPGFCDEFTRY